MHRLWFKHHRFPPEIIRHSTWLYARFTLSFRDVEDWHLDGMVIVIRGKRYWLWRAMDNEGDVE